MVVARKGLEIQRLAETLSGISAVEMQLWGSASPFAHSEPLAIRVLYEPHRMSQRSIGDTGNARNEDPGYERHLIGRVMMANERDAQAATKEATARGKAAADETANAAANTTRRAADAAKDMASDAAEKGAENTQRTVQAGAETTRRITDASVEMSRRTAETTREATTNLTDTAMRAAGMTSEQLQRLFGFGANGQGEVAQQAQHNVEAMVQCGSVLMDGMQSVWREYLSFTQEAMQRQMNGLSTIMRTRSVPDFYAAQSDLVKDELELWLNRSVRISELSAQTANDAARRLTERAEEAKQTLRR